MPKTLTKAEHEFVQVIHKKGMLEDIMKTRNACKVMYDSIFKELEEVTKKTKIKYSSGFPQASALLHTIEQFYARELTAFCMLLSISQIATPISTDRTKEEVEDIVSLVIDGAEALAAIRLSSTSKALGAALNSKDLKLRQLVKESLGETEV